MIWTFTYVIKISDMWIHGKRPEVKVLMFKLHLFYGKSAFVPKSRCFTCSVHCYICQYEEYLHDCRSIKISWTNRRIADCFTSPPNKLCISSVQLLSCVQLFVTPRTAAPQASPSITSSWSLLKLMSIESVMPSSHLILCCPLFLLPPIPPSIRVFFNESTLLMRWPKYWSFSFSISPSNEHPGLISFRMDWLDLLQSKELSRVFYNTTVQKHQVFGAQLSL